MRLPGAALALLCSLLAVGVHCRVTVADLPPCGLTCLLSAIPAAGCSLTDAACQCSNKGLAQASTLCLLQNCTMQDSLVVSKVQASICNLPSEDQSNRVIIISSVLVGFAALFVILRVFTKGYLSNVYGLDDCIITFALLLLVPIMYFTVTMCKEGFGKHVWDLEEGNLLRVLKNFYIAENMYVVILGAVKISVLVFYLSLFPYPLFRFTIYVAILFIGVSTTILSFLTIFQCKPVQYFWNKDLRGTCININALAYANSAMSIVQDLLIVVLPIPVLSRLQLGRRKKIGVIFMFAVGSFGCIVSMIRLRSLVIFGNSIDPTWDYTTAVVWTGVEMAVAMMCACFPAIRRLLVRIYPRTFASTNEASSDRQRPSKSWYNPNVSQQQSHMEDDSGQFIELRDSRDPEAPFPVPLPPPQVTKAFRGSVVSAKSKCSLSAKMTWYNDQDESR